MKLRKQSAYSCLNILLALNLAAPQLCEGGGGLAWAVITMSELAVPLASQAAEPQRPPLPAVPPGAFQFSSNPADAEISSARVFDEPLVPLEGASVPDENYALAQSIRAYAHRSSPDDCSSLAAFAQGHPQSRWTGPLLLHLGREYFNYGYFSRALDCWQRAWDLCKDSSAPAGKAEADRALGELARLYSKLGRAGELTQLLESAGNRDLTGPATQLVHAARDALWTMRNKPSYSFGCGPSALDRILLRNDPSKAGNPILLDCKSSTNGFSLSQVAELAGKLGMNYQIAFRSPDSAIIVPAVVHWKVDHFAALVEARDGRFLAQDYTFHNTIWMSTNALDAEASGYFLVPSGPLPSGWRSVSESEAALVWGKGVVGTQDGDGTGDYDPTCGGCRFVHGVKSFFSGIANFFTGGSSRGMTTYTMHAMLASLTLDDIPVGYEPPVGQPVLFRVTYNQREANQPAIFSYFNLGPKWDCNWLSYITDNPLNPNADVTLYEANGGTLHFTGIDLVTHRYLPEPMSQAVLTRTSASTYELLYPDGRRNQFGQTDGSIGSTRRVFLSATLDPAGNAVQMNYDSQLRLTNIVDAIGQATVFGYTNSSFPLSITSVTDPFGRSAQLQYDTNGLLLQITDPVGIVSHYTYGTNQFITALTTPYGVSTFATGQTNGITYLQATDPLGGTERVEYNQNTVVPHSYPDSLVPHGLSTFNLFLDARNSFYWDKKAFAEGAGDYSKAQIFHWLHSTPNPDQCARILESTKAPLENRVWFNYAGQSTNFGAPYYLDAAYTGASSKPSVVSRILDDGTTQTYTYGYNALGNLTNSIDPLGRSFTYVYSTNNLDLLEVRMTHNGKNELMGKSTYNAQHLPLTVTDASGQTTTNTYNSRGQLLTISDPQNHTTTITYDVNGRLRTATGPLGAAWRSSVVHL